MFAESILEVDRVHKSIGEGNNRMSILAGVNLIVKSAETIALIGESGSGKSTLLSLLAGLDNPSTGKIKLLGQPLKNLTEDARAKLRANNIGFVFQSFMLVPTLTALENVQLPALLRHDNETDSQRQAIALLTQLGLGKRLHHLPAQLSGGEQQRVALARAFCSRPKILFADEPTGNLDSKTGGKIADLLFSLNKQHATTLILVTHDERLAARCQRCFRLSHGQLQQVFLSGEYIRTNQHVTKHPIAPEDNSANKSDTIKQEEGL